MKTNEERAQAHEQDADAHRIAAAHGPAFGHPVAVARHIKNAQEHDRQAAACHTKPPELKDQGFVEYIDQYFENLDIGDYETEEMAVMGFGSLEIAIKEWKEMIADFAE